MSPSSFVCLTTFIYLFLFSSATKEARHASDAERQWLPINFFVFVPRLNNTFPPPPYSPPLRTLSSASPPLTPEEEERLHSEKGRRTSLSRASSHRRCGINSSASLAHLRPINSVLALRLSSSPEGQSGTSPPPSGQRPAAPCAREAL